MWATKGHSPLVAKAEEIYTNDKVSHVFLGKCLADVGWNHHQFPRELMAYIIQDLPASLEHVLYQAFLGPSTTKEICESTFAWLHYKVQSTTRNSTMSDWTKYAYCILSPYTEASGMNQLLPDKDDWHIIRSEAGKDFRGSAAKFLSIQSTEMPSGVPHLDADKMNKKWAKAGVLSDERSIAAVAYLLEEAENNWSRITTHWTGDWA